MRSNAPIMMSSSGGFVSDSLPLVAVVFTLTTTGGVLVGSSDADVSGVVIASDSVLSGVVDTSVIDSSVVGSSVVVVVWVVVVVVVVVVGGGNCFHNA